MEIWAYGFSGLFTILGAALVLIFLWQKEKVQQEKLLQKQVLSTLLPLRIAALERAALFVERNQPENLFARLEADRHTSVVDFVQLVYQSVQAEFEHNAAQQIHMGWRTWQALQKAKEELFLTLRETLQSMPYGSLAQWIEAFYEKWKSKTPNPFLAALGMIHYEMQQLRQKADI
ncbi:MAG: DUF7935 family protein [Bacteroidia bacterium]